MVFKLVIQISPSFCLKIIAREYILLGFVGALHFIVIERFFSGRIILIMDVVDNYNDKINGDLSVHGEVNIKNCLT